MAKIEVTFFHDSNWKIRGYQVNFNGVYAPSLVGEVQGLLLGTRLALQELKAYSEKIIDVDVYEINVLRVNKNTMAILKPLELGIKELESKCPDFISVRQF